MDKEFTELKSIQIPTPKTPTVLTISQSLDDIETLESIHPKDHPRDDPKGESVVEEHVKMVMKGNKIAAK